MGEPKGWRYLVRAVSSSGAVKESLNVLQKIFRIRNCSESFFRNRTRPCLQYQINRCTAPCVGYITPEEYHQDIRHATMFLEGKNPAILHDLMNAMEAASKNLEFEKAAAYRDQINHLRHVQEQQSIEGEGGDADVIAIAQDAGVVCIVVIIVRGGRVLGTKDYFPATPSNRPRANCSVRSWVSTILVATPAGRFRGISWCRLKWRGRNCWPRRSLNQRTGKPGFGATSGVSGVDGWSWP